MPSACAQSYIDFEIAEGERARTAALYERLLNRTTHVKVGPALTLRSFQTLPKTLTQKHVPSGKTPYTLKAPHCHKPLRLESPNSY